MDLGGGASGGRRSGGQGVVPSVIVVIAFVLFELGLTRLGSRLLPRCLYFKRPLLVERDLLVEFFFKRPGGGDPGVALLLLEPRAARRGVLLRLLGLLLVVLFDLLEDLELLLERRPKEVWFLFQYDKRERYSVSAKARNRIRERGRSKRERGSIEEEAVRRRPRTREMSMFPTSAAGLVSSRERAFRV